MKKILLTNFSVFLTLACLAQIKVAPIQTDRVQNQNVQNVNIAKKQVAFRLSPYSLSSLPANASTVLNLTVKEFDLGNDTRGSSFVAPETGVYHFDARLNFGPQIADTKNYLRFHLIFQKTNGAEIEKASVMNAGLDYTPFHTLSISTTIALNAGESVNVVYMGDANPGTPAVSVSSASFSGFKVADFTAGSGASGIR